MKFFALFILTYASISNAGIFLEPYLGYLKGESESQLTTSTLSGDVSGIGYGARLGFTLGGYIFLAGDALLVKGEYKNDNMTQNEDMETLAYSGVVGLRFWGIRTWYGHTFKVDSELESSGTAQEYEGDGWKVGIGKIFFGKISLNAEFIKIEYNKLDNQNIPTSSLLKSESSNYLVSIGFPI